MRSFSVRRHGVIKYVELVQRPEREEHVDILTHQKWSGANLMDKQVKDQGTQRLAREPN